MINQQQQGFAFRAISEGVIRVVCEQVHGDEENQTVGQISRSVEGYFEIF